MSSSRLNRVYVLVRLCALALPLLSIAVMPGEAEAKRRPAKVKIVKPSETFSVELTSRVGKKSLTRDVVCYQGKPGSLSATRKGMTFTPIQTELDKLKAKGKQGTTKYKLLSGLQKQGNSQCRNPNFLALEKYSGPFGAREAQILFNRFAFGASRAQIQQAVQRGLKATVESLTTYRNDPTMNSQFNDLACDSYFANDPWNGEADERNHSCNPYNPNDLSKEGLRRAMLWRFAYSDNPFFEKFWFWIADERLAVSQRVLSWDETHAAREYVQVLDSAVQTGDYKQYMKDINGDPWNSNKAHFVNLNWLDGAVNRGYSPNENWAREFWELGTVGAHNLDGNPNYTTNDIAQAALAHSGWTFVEEPRDVPGEDDPQYFKYAAFSSAYHDPRPKTIFEKTPYSAVVYDANDLLEATFRHPRTSESLAEDLCAQFIRPDCPAIFVRKIAEDIRKNNFKLIPVFKKLMMSRALFDNENRNTLIKHPVDLLMGFIRQTQIRMTPDEMDYWLDDMDERPLDAPTVFGWDEHRLAGESYIPAWRNVALDIANYLNGDRLRTERNLDLHQVFLPDNPTSLAAIDRVAATLGLALNEAQKNSLDQYMNFDRTRCQNWHVNQYHCTVGDMFLYRTPFDSYPQGNWETKLEGLITLLVMQPEYRMK